MAAKSKSEQSFFAADVIRQTDTIQRQFRRVERLNRLDVQSRHAGIKARSSGNEKREEKPRLKRWFISVPF